MTHSEPMLRDAAALCAAAEAKRTRGDVLDAHDIVQRGLEHGLASPRLAYLSALLAADLGDHVTAMRLYEQHDLARRDDSDALALEGRILKEKAFITLGPARHEMLKAAADSYARAYALFGGHYPAINAASLLMLAGEHDAGRALAGEVQQATATCIDDYWTLASHLEACLLVGNHRALEGALRLTELIEGASLADRAATIRQLRRLCHAGAIDAVSANRVVDLLRAPPVLVYCGHMFVHGDPAEADLKARIAAQLDRLGSTIAYGPLACGADIVIAEALLERGAELNIVLPFQEADFLDQSVRCGGSGWEARYRTAMAAANEVILASDTAFVGDDHQFAYGTRVAMGIAQIRARHVEADAIQMAVVADVSAALSRSTIAGAGADVAQWQALGRETVVVAAGPVDRTLRFPSAPPSDETLERGAYSILFADYKGFSRLDERQLPIFASQVMGTIGDVLDRFGDAISFRNTWGDAIYVIISTPVIAARVAVELQQALAVPPAALRGDDDAEMGMRIGVHHGPIYRGQDRVLGQPLWFGTEVTRTARIEPVTPTGAVYCTEAFAAMLALEPDDSYACHYVGRVTLAKGYGQIGMYRLRQR